MYNLFKYLLLLGFGLSFNPISASDKPVCNVPDEFDMTNAVLFGNGTPSSCTQSALQGLLDNGGKIKCNCGTNPYTLVLTSTLKIPNKEIILDGLNKLSISGNNLVRIFDKAPAMNQSNGTLFGIQNLNIINGKLPASGSDGGGSAFMGRAFGSLVAHNVNFQSNVASVAHPDECGAVYTILYKEASFYNCTFKNNKGANGGAVGCIGSGTKIIQCTFEANEATGNGGIPPGKGGNGGAVYMDGADQNGVNNYFEMCGNQFVNNKAIYQAGAVNVIFYANKGSIAKVDQCNFENSSCTVDKGGAYYHMNGPLNISNSSFINNTSPAQGGGIWCNNTKLNINNSTFIGNKAVSADKKGGLGGAICIDGSGNEKSVIVSNSTISGSQAGNFASAIFNGGTLSLENNIFYNNLIGMDYQGNPYGGGLINKSSNLTVSGGNLQFPFTYKTQFENARTDDWITQVGEAKIIKSDPLLLPLADNGGFTKTMALGSTSPAINKGTNCPSKDQRGLARVGVCDLGAFEFGAVVTSIAMADRKNSSQNSLFYPNPVERGGLLKLINHQENYPHEVNIYTLQGTLVKNYKTGVPFQELTISEDIQGLYMLELIFPNKKSHSIIRIE
ncbi:MAG: T9SS C-terminal target domain-containing protein [Cytophagales bacterium]|nr:MAG: T9SS C-terminal target domain-containing protein [Cytophagales bacterium]